MLPVSRCPTSLRDRALQTVVAAFAVDPVLRWAWPQDERYDACAPGFFGLLLDLRLASGEVWVTPDAGAVAMWDPPGGLYLPTPPETWPALQESFRPEERARWQAFEASMQIPAGTPPYWYLGVLATAPQLQRQGLGRAVVAPMLGAADRAGLATYLETAGEANVAFYAGLGFAPVLDATMPDGPRCWLLRREPEAPRRENSSA